LKCLIQEYDLAQGMSPRKVDDLGQVRENQGFEL
jgi:hypothetical protein